MSAQIPESIALDLLHKLAHDDAFRATFASDPAAALGSLGVEQPTALSATALQHLGQQALASKESLAQSHRALSLMRIEAMVPFVPITLEMPAPSRAA